MAQVAAPAVRIVSSIDESQRVTLKGTMHPLASAANDRGAVADSMKLERMHLVLKRSDSQESALRQLIGELHTPGTASYHKWLTPDQFGKQFGPSDQDIATVQAWLTSHGFSVTQVNPGKQTLEFSGSAGQMREAFHTQIHQYQVKGETHYANANDPQIPAALAPVVGGFVSLNNFRVKSYVKPLGKATYDPKTDKATPQWTIGGNGSYSFALAPGDYAVQYDLNPLYSAGIKGAGQTIAIVNDSNVNIDLVNQFRSLFNLPVNPPQVIIDGNDPGVDGINNPDGPNGDSVEAYLDVEWAGAVAPNATVDLVIAADTQLENGLQLAAEHAVYGNVAPIISLSFGSCEPALGTYNQFLSGLWEQAAAQGITVLVSTGDSGSAGCDDDNTQEYAVSGQAVNGFGSTPFNVAVGGTDFYYSDWATGGASIANYWSLTPSNAAPAVSILGVIPEQPWNASQFGLNINSQYSYDGTTDIAGGSGGASNCQAGSGSTSSGGWLSCTGGYAKPSWQTGFGDTMRDLPDVSLFASSGINASYYPICATDGDCQTISNGTVQIFGVGGTSASTPSFAGIMALVNQEYGRQGQANYVLYPLAAQFQSSAHPPFHDVTVGTNTVPCATGSPDCIAAPAGLNYTITDPSLGTAVEGQIGTGTTPEYNAALGYDLASGLGTIDAYNLVTDWNKVTFNKSTTTLSIPTSFTHGQSISVSGTVTGSPTPTGDVALVTDSTEQTNQGENFFTLTNGAYSSSTVNYLPGGTYNVWAQYGGDANNALSTSAKTQVTVSPEGSSILFLLLTPSSSGAEYISSGTNNIPYGTQLSLSALPAPSAQYTAFVNCEIGSATTCPSFQYPTGTVTFKDGSTTLNTAPVNVEGEAEFTPPASFNAGAHSVTAVYSGDNSYNGSSSATINFTVVQSLPSVLLTAPLTSYTQGQAATVNILVESYGNGAAPTGTVTLSGVPAGTPTTATLSAGVDPSQGTTVGLATVVIPATAAAGNYSITASYTPDSASSANYAAASSAALGVQITAASGIATTTAASASANSTSPAARVLVTGTVTAASGAAPTGTVYLLEGVVNPYSNGNSGEVVALGSTTLVPGSGTSSTFSTYFNSSALLQGANQITVLYGASATDATSSALINIANPLSDFSLIPNTTLVQLNSGNSYSNTDTIQLASVNGFSGTVGLTCTAALGTNCSITPSVTLGTGGIGTATLTVNTGTWAYPANIPYNVLITGTSGAYVHTLGVQGVVSGSPAGSTSFMVANSGSIAVEAGATTGNTSTITVTPVGGFTGSVALTCAVTPTTGTPPTCSVSSPVTISSTSAVTATLTLNSTLSTTGGAYTVTVTGTSGSIAPTTAVTATVTAPGLALSNGGSINIGTAGATTGNTSLITVTPSNGLTGAVALSCAVTPQTGTPPTCTMTPPSVTISGTAAQTATLTMITTASTTLGSYSATVTGTYGGTITSSTVVSVTVGTPAISFTSTPPNPSTITISSPGLSGTSTISVMPSGGFSGTVNLSCSFVTNAATDPATCSLSPTSVAVSGTTAQTSTLTVYTTAATTSSNQMKKLFWPSAGGAALALVFLFGIPKRRRNWLAMLGLLLVFVSAAVVGCGGGGGTGGTGTSNAGTTAGTYTVTVTGTSGSVTGSTTVTLTVN